MDNNKKFPTILLEERHKSREEKKKKKKMFMRSYGRNQGSASSQQQRTPQQIGIDLLFDKYKVKDSIPAEGTEKLCGSLSLCLFVVSLLLSLLSFRFTSR